MVDLSEYEDLAKINKALSHPVRLYILSFLNNQACCYTGELTELLPYSQATISQHLKILKDAGLIKGKIETPKVRYCIHPENWLKAKRLINQFFENRKGSTMKKILVLCTGNSCRSQMAEGWLRHFAKDKAEIYSAGIETHGVNPNAIKYMNESGIDISKHTSNNVNEYMQIQFDFIITVCDHAKENCPYIPSKAKRFHHNFSDPSKIEGSDEEIANAFRKTRDEIKEYSEKFIGDHFSNEC